MAKLDRLIILFVVIIGYSALMNIVLFSFLENEEKFSPKDLKTKLKGFIRHHRNFGEQNNSEHYDALDTTKNENQPMKQTNDAKVDSQKHIRREESAVNSGNDSDDKEHIINILKSAGTEITPEIIDQIPTWSEVKALYGDKPKIYGLDQCSRFQLEIPEKDAYVGPSGLFNTGTNLLADLLIDHCKLPKRKWNRNDHRDSPVKAPWRMTTGMLYQVPWGKHNPVSWRTHHSARLNPPEVVQEHVLPVVMIKDPFYWMGSLCRHKYATNWFHTKNHCPNLVPNKYDFGNRGITRMTKTVPVRVRFHNSPPKVTQYESMLDVWNTWNGDYLEIDEFPRLMIRFEDLLFHSEEVLTQICTCAGGKVTNDRDGLHLESQAAKQGTVHNGSNGLLSAIIKYGSAKHRLDGLTADDIKYANEAVRSDMMELFSYAYPQIPGESSAR